MAYELEPLAESHRKPIVDIYNYYVSHGFAAYYDEPVGYEFFDRLLEMARGYPSLAVLDEAGVVVGFAFLHAYHPGRAFRRTAEVTYFLHPEHTRRGIGTRLLAEFRRVAKDRGIQTLLASISSRNEESLGFHREHGFWECGRLREIGEKLGRRFDVVWMQLDL